MITHVAFQLLSAQECAALVNEIDDVLGEDDPDDDYGRQRVRNAPLSGALADKLRDAAIADKALTQMLGGDANFYLNHFWFYTRYPPGGHLQGHYDGVTTCDDAVSVATLLIYLNDDFEGGSTAFLDGERVVSEVVPTKGGALVLRQDAFHAGTPVTRGTKYLLRTDVMRELAEARPRPP